MLDVNKCYLDGAPIRQLNWNSSFWRLLEMLNKLEQNAKFTQGSWHTDNSYIFSADRTIAQVLGNRPLCDAGAGWLKMSVKDACEMQKANARLMAAAPEMYRLLRHIIKTKDVSKTTIDQVEQLLARVDKDIRH